MMKRRCIILCITLLLATPALAQDSTETTTMIRVLDRYETIFWSVGGVLVALLVFAQWINRVLSIKITERVPLETVRGVFGLLESGASATKTTVDDEVIRRISEEVEKLIAAREATSGGFQLQTNSVSQPDDSGVG